MGKRLINVNDYAMVWLDGAAFLVEALLPKYLPGIPPVFVAGASAGGHLAQTAHPSS